MRDGPSTRDDNGRRRYEVRCCAASVDGCLRQLATGRNGVGAGIDNDPGDGLGGLAVHSSQVPTQRATLSSCAGQCPDADEGEWDATYKQRSGRGEVLTEEFWRNCFVVRCSLFGPSATRQARKDSNGRRVQQSKATKPPQPASHGEECPGVRCQQHTPAAALAAIAQPRASAAQPSSNGRGVISSWCE